MLVTRRGGVGGRRWMTRLIPCCLAERKASEESLGTSPVAVQGCWLACSDLTLGSTCVCLEQQDRKAQGLKGAAERARADTTLAEQPADQTVDPPPP